MSDQYGEIRKHPFIAAFCMGLMLAVPIGVGLLCGWIIWGPK